MEQCALPFGVAKEVAVMPEEAEQSGETRPRILRGRVASFALYEITDSELDLLEAGSPSSFRLNFAIFFLSIAASLLSSLITSTVSSRVFTVFVVLIVVGIAGGGYLLILWFNARRSVSDVVRRIRARIPGDDVRGEDQQGSG
jgi:hypothetical protein